MFAMEKGQDHPLGVLLDETGCHFCVWAPQSDMVELCLFDEQEQELVRLALPGRRGQYRFGYVRGVKAGQRYGYRVHGAPQEGMLFDPQKLLIDPYARALSRATHWDDKLYEGDSAAMVAKSVVVDD
ncbi:MAG: glycogen debranching protein GlgX, partial [Aeromonas salmonicida]